MDNGIERLRDNVASIEVAMLTTVKPSGRLRSRPMYTVQLDKNGTLWFFTEAHSLKLDDIVEHTEVNLSYADIHSHTYISITGTAMVILDETVKERFRESLHTDWFPANIKMEDLCLLKIEIQYSEMWNPETSNMETVMGSMDSI